MESVRLEIVAAVAIEPVQVMQFVQALRGVPKDALCEIRDVYARASLQLMHTQVQLSCEPVVTEFLCATFGTQRKHVVAGEIAQIRCCRARPGSLSLKGAAASDELRLAASAQVREAKCLKVPPNVPIQPTTLSMDKVIALIECLGDKVVDARDAYEVFADANDTSQLQRMNLLGLVKALAQLCSSEWTINQTPATAVKAQPSKARQQQQQLKSRDSMSNTSVSEALDTSLTVANLRRLLSRMIATDAISLTELPSTAATPCLSYTDFLACYVAFLSLMHASSSSSSTHARA